MDLTPVTLETIGVIKHQKPNTAPKKAKKLNLKNPFILIDNCNRGVLNEGRNYGLSCAFTKRDGSQLTTIQPLSSCLDYLNDVLYTEHTGKDFSACGLNTSKKNIFDPNGYLVFGILPYSSGIRYSNQDRDTLALQTTGDSGLLENFINQWEILLKVEGRTKIVKLEENRYLSIVPPFWCQYSYLISLYAKLLRNGIFYKEGDVFEFLKATRMDNDDANTMAYYFPKIERLIKGERPVQNWGSFHHSMGLSGFKF